MSLIVHEESVAYSSGAYMIEMSVNKGPPKEIGMQNWEAQGFPEAHSWRLRFGATPVPKNDGRH